MPYKNREAQLSAQRRHYQNNKVKYRENTKKRQTDLKQYVWRKKTHIGCSCGESNPSCLDFHHTTEDKHKTVAQLIRDGVAREKIDKEIGKCEVLCANCHHKLHRPINIKDGSQWNKFNEARVAKRRWFIQFMERQICVKCFESDSRCLEHHHVQHKRFGIAYLLTSGHSISFLKEELSRCIVLCSNCHRKEHELSGWEE